MTSSHWQHYISPTIRHDENMKSVECTVQETMCLLAAILHVSRQQSDFSRLKLRLTPVRSFRQWIDGQLLDQYRPK